MSEKIKPFFPTIMKLLHIAAILLVLWVISPRVFSALEEFILMLIKLVTTIVGNVDLPLPIVP